MGGHIFVSYGRADSAYVRRLVAWLTRSGVDVWFDNDIPTGERWEAVLRERVASCRALLLVMSPDAGASAWVAKEVELARRLGKRVLPLRLDGEILFGLDAVQVEDVRGGRMPSPALVDQLRGMAPRRAVIGHQIGLVPKEADCFQHRPVADELEAALAAGQAAILTGTGAGPAVQILSGLGGVGKTQLAASLARGLRDRGELDLLVWISARSRDAIVTGYAHAATEVIGADPADPEQAATAFLAHLATTTGRWLVVLDDLADPKDLDGWWPPQTPTGRVVVTTRRRDAALAGHGRLLPVDLFTAQEAYAYLAAKFRHQPHRLEQADQLVEDLGRLPVALAQAAAYIADRDLTCAQYRARFAAHPLARLAPDAWPDEYARPVAVTLMLSVELADQLEPVGLAGPLLSVLSLLDPNGVPIHLLTTDPIVDYLTDAVGRSVDAEQARDALTCLTRLNLADTTDGGGSGVVGRPLVRVHALVQRAAREHTPPALIASAAHAAADGLVQLWPPIERDTALAQVLRANTAALRTTAEDHLWEPDAHALLFRAGQSVGEAGLVTAAIDHFHALHTEADRRLGPDHRHTLVARGKAIRWRGEAGDVAGAIAAEEGLLADCLRVLGPDHPDTLAARSNLAVWRGEAGNVAGAVTEYEALLADQLRVLGPDHPDTLTTRSNLAAWRGQAGDVTAAVTEHEALLADHLRVFGPDHPDTLATRSNLAAWRGEAGDVAAAVTAYQTLLADYVRVLGPDHPDTLTIRHSLARWRGEAGDVAGAVTTYEALLADRLRVLGPDHPDTLTTRSNLAAWRGQAGDVAGALTAYEALLADRLRVLGPDHPDTLATRHNLAEWCGQAGNAVAAAAAFAALLADCLRVLGPDHPQTLTSRSNLARWRGEAGDAAAAVTEYETLLADRLRVLGPDHPDTLAARHNLADWRGRAGDPAAAVATYEALLPDHLRVLGPDHPNTLATRHNLARWRGEAGDAAGAVAAYEALLADWLRILGPDHPDTLATRHNLAYWHGQAGDAAAAAAGFAALLADCLRVLGPHHPNTRAARHNLARWRGEARKAAGAAATALKPAPQRRRSGRRR